MGFPHLTTEIIVSEHLKKIHTHFPFGVRERKKEKHMTDVSHSFNGLVSVIQTPQ